MTWTLWSAIPLIIFSASVSEGAGLQSLFTLSAGIGPLLVVAVILRRPHESYWRFTRLDWACLILSLVAITLWVATRNGDLAIALSLVADLAAAFPTLVKAYRDPSSESGAAYLVFMAGAVMELSATKHWTVANSAFPVYATALSVVFSSLIVGPRRWRRTHTSTHSPGSSRDH
ncbi:MAG TPA: hypothetical protein VGS21_05845 [Acidimicrobiales bacterium]|nr:hypothetical protein [Acidimicrobiales bacterium]